MDSNFDVVKTPIPHPGLHPVNVDSQPGIFSRISGIVAKGFEYLTNGAQHAVEAVIDQAFDLNESFEKLLTTPFTFARKTHSYIDTNPFTEEELKSLNDCLQDVDNPLFGDKKFQMEQIALCQQALAELDKLTRGRPDTYEFRERLMAEILTKRLAHLDPPKGQKFNIPYFGKDGKPLMVEFEVTHKITLADTHIPLIVLTPTKRNLEPIVLFRGTAPHLSSQGGMRSLLENLDTEGPARGVYEKSLPQLKKLMDQVCPPGLALSNVRVMGYSQGSVMAKRFIVDFADRVSQRTPSMLFNGPGMEPDYKAKWDAVKAKPPVQEYLISRDIISKAGQFFMGDLFEVEPEEGSMLDAHLGTKMNHAGWKMYRIDKDAEENCSVRAGINAIRTSDRVKSIYDFVLSRVHYLEKIVAHTELRRNQISIYRPALTMSI